MPMIYSPPLFHIKPPVNPTRILTSLLYCGQSVRTFPGSGIAPARNLAVSTRVHSLVRQSSSYNLTFNDEDFNVDLGRLLDILPEEMRRRVTEHPERRFLIEVVMDLGRKPLARFPSGDFVLSDHPITAEDIQRATSQVGDFAVDNRAGISRTLHRISAIRNREGVIIGLTCRVGRAVSGSANLLRDLVKEGASLLLIGPPGVGKTTIIRDIARMLANEYKKRVMIVDTSNEIGGDGDIPHAGIGNARRMQVPHSDVQHKVLIEAVENHMPQVIVIDEIGTKLEALAASTIAQRGIQLVATAHGVTIENLIMNPALEMLVGGVQSVTLGDEEANRRGVQKTVLERKGPSTFSCGVEIISKTELRVHCNLEATVDAVLSGRNPRFEFRKINLGDAVEAGLITCNLSETQGQSRIQHKPDMSDITPFSEDIVSEENSGEDKDGLCIFLYGISEASMVQGMKQFQGMKQLKIDGTFEYTDNMSEADVLIALQSKFKKNSRLQASARSRGIPTYICKTNSLAQLTKTIQSFMSDFADGLEIFESEAKTNESEKMDALEEARIAIEQVVIPKGEPVDLLPRPSNILLLQKNLIRKYKLPSERVESETGVRMRILPLQSKIEDDIPGSEDDDDANEDDDDANNIRQLHGIHDETNGSIFFVDRLPFLPD